MATPILTATTIVTVQNVTALNAATPTAVVDQIAVADQIAVVVQLAAEPWAILSVPKLAHAAVRILAPTVVAQPFAVDRYVVAGSRFRRDFFRASRRPPASPA